MVVVRWLLVLLLWRLLVVVRGRAVRLVHRGRWGPVVCVLIFGDLPHGFKKRCRVIV